MRGTEIPLPLHLLQSIPILASIVVLVASGVRQWPMGGFVVVCVSMGMMCLGEMVRRAEAAAAACQAAVGSDSSDPDTMMRAAAQWGADVLGRVARGESAERAVAASVPRVRVGAGGYAASEAGSDVSTTELQGLGGNGDDWLMAAARSVGTTPVQDELAGARAAELRSVARMASVPENAQYQRAHSSPPRIQYVNGGEGVY